jgi:hypothetical protein
MLKKKPTFQLPFVTTFALASTAVVVACGGHIDGSTFGSSGSTPGPCPAAEPSAGDGCDTGAASCFYNAGPCGHEYQCSRGRFEQVVGSCNPPPTCNIAPGCPAEQPTPGTPCSATTCVGVAALTCSYGSCLGQPNITARCNASTGEWDVATISCNPPMIDGGVKDVVVVDAVTVKDGASTDD